MFTDRTFCSLPFSSIQINPGGDFKVCCFSGSHGNHGMAEEDDGTMMNIMTHDIEEAFNSVLHREIRLAQSKDERHPCCEVCWIRDDAAGASHRTVRSNRMREFDGTVKLEDAGAAMNPDGTIDRPVLVDLDIRFGNLCNAKCLHCGPIYSNLWYEDYVRFERKTKFNVGAKTYNIRSENGVLKSDLTDNKWWETDRWWSQFDRIKGRLRKIYVTGGEPFLVPAHDEMLDRLIAAGLACSIEMWYDTNLSAINPRILTKLGHFKRVYISVSLDDVEERYELFRNPLKVGKLVENLKLLGKYNLTANEISSCIGIPTATSILRLVPFFGEIGYDMYRLRLLRHPAEFDLKHLPRAEKIKLIDRHQNSNVGHRNSVMIMGYLRNNLDVEDPGMVQRFIKRMDAHDSMRRTDWRSVMPDVAEMVGA